MRHNLNHLIPNPGSCINTTVNCLFFFSAWDIKHYPAFTSWQKAGNFYIAIFNYNWGIFLINN